LREERRPVIDFQSPHRPARDQANTIDVEDLGQEAALRDHFVIGRHPWETPFSSGGAVLLGDEELPPPK
jgi:hypothetical protein